MRSCELKGQESNIGETEEWGETGDKKKNQKREICFIWCNKWLRNAKQCMLFCT